MKISMNKSLCAAVFGALLSSVSSLQAAQPQVVVELFTSQGCSSCPPADAVLGRLATDPDIIAISRPVTYWDRLGWKDTLARPQNTQLQYAYAASMQRGEVYTPQAVVGGRADVLGSNESGLRTAVKDAQRSAIALDWQASANGVITLRPQHALPAKARFRIVRVTPVTKIAIGSGENGGRAITYHNVVTDEARVVATYSAESYRFALPPGKGRAALLIDSGEATPIIASAWLTSVAP